MKLNYSNKVGTVYQLVVTISILVAQILSMESILGTETLWPVLLGLTIIPAIYQLASLPFCPESPKYTLLNKGKEIESQRGIRTKLLFSVSIRKKKKKIEEKRNRFVFL